MAFEVIRSACRSEELKLCESQRDVWKRVERGEGRYEDGLHGWIALVSMAR